MSQFVRWNIRMPLIMIKKARKEEKEASSSTLYDTSTVCPTMLSGLATSPNHSTTEWLHSLWSQSAPISLCYKLCLHTVSADHLLVQHCLLKTEMTEHGGGRGGWLSGVVLVCLLRVWLEKRETSAPILKHSLHIPLFLFICQIFKKVRKGGEEKRRNMHVCVSVSVFEREKGIVSLCWSM